MRPLHPFAQFSLATAAALLLAACGGRDDGALGVALIGSEDAVFADGVRLAEGAQHVRAATESGLVALNGLGEVVPALAERWIVTDDGLSFIFRLRDTPWPDGSEMTAPSARTALVSAIARLEGTSLGQDLMVIEEVRAMTGRVIEIRLEHPEPYLLQLLAQPELALRHPDGGTGPLAIERNGASARLWLKPPLERGEPATEDWQEDVRDINLRVVGAQQAIAMFDEGEAALVIGGDLGNLPLVETGPLSTGTLRIDSTFGLFGLQVLRGEGLLGDVGVREGIAMAIDRQGLIEPFNIGGWAPTTRLVSPGLPNDPGLIAERWNNLDMADRRQQARNRVRGWRSRNEVGDISQPAQLSVLMGRGPGWDALFNSLARQLAEIDIALVRAEDLAQADLLLIDRIARYPSPRWFLNQFNCSLRRGLCSEDVDILVAQAAGQSDPQQRATLMAQAEAELTLANVYIPIATPLRWSLVRGGVDGFEANANAFHPLPALAEIPR